MAVVVLQSWYNPPNHVIDGECRCLSWLRTALHFSISFEAVLTWRIYRQVASSNAPFSYFLLRERLYTIQASEQNIPLNRNAYTVCRETLIPVKRNLHCRDLRITRVLNSRYFYYERSNEKLFKRRFFCKLQNMRLTLKECH